VLRAGWWRMTAVYLSKLNDEQRRAVEHGCDDPNVASPLLIIAGAGSGKTNTLANRVAHLIVFAFYVEAKQKQNVLDYDDLLLYWAQMMTEGSIAQDISDRFDHVLVDEYQDTNRLQSSILLALKPNGRGLTVVGDDAQSIYSFRAATVRNILDFPGQFSPKAEIITLARANRFSQQQTL
jgi:superfamily I DNA/RNA helicase